jgi:hypothetical protein
LRRYHAQAKNVPALLIPFRRIAEVALTRTLGQFPGLAPIAPSVGNSGPFADS